LFNGILTFAVTEKVISTKKLRKGVAHILMKLAWFGNTLFEIGVSLETSSVATGGFGGPSPHQTNFRVSQIEL